MNSKGAAEILEISPRTAQAWARKGLIPCLIIAHARQRTYIFDRDVIVQIKKGVAPQAVNDEIIEPDFKELENHYAEKKNP